MNKIFLMLFGMAIGCSGFAMPAFSEDGRDIMLKNYNVYEGEDSKSVLTMELINKNGKKRVREVLYWALERGDEDKSLMYFLKPPADKGTAFLTWEHKTKDDDQWLCLPALKKVKRISAAEKDKAFMGTDFSYNDLAPPHPDEFTHQAAGDETLDGQPCYIIESIHKSHTGDPAWQNQKKYPYSRQRSWIRKDNFLLVKAIMFDKKAKACKTFYASKIQLIDNVWTAMALCMKSLDDEHQTILTIREIDYNIGLSDAFFTARELEKPR